MSAPSFDLSGSTALVTGGSRGLGAAIALALARAGAHVIAVARDRAALDQLCARHDRIEGWAADIRDPAFPARLSTLDIDILVNNAGTNRPMPMADVPADLLDEMLELNVRGSYLVAQAAVRAMLRRRQPGAIVNISSQMGRVGSPNRTVYCMTKHAIEGLTKAMAVELAPHRIRVNAVAPTFVQTPMTGPMLADPAFRAFVDRMLPMGRLATPEDVAAAVLYLVSPLAGMITGTSLLVDGGWTAQ